jgi:hypothetical protein
MKALQAALRLFCAKRNSLARGLETAPRRRWFNPGGWPRLFFKVQFFSSALAIAPGTAEEDYPLQERKSGPGVA